jgi:uncharacterized protein (TIGR00369 family)
VSLASLQRVLAGEYDPAPVASLIGFRLTDVAAGAVTVELQAGPQHTSPPGTLHGGVLCDIADAAMGMALFSLLEESQAFATVELKINFLKPVWTGLLTAEGTVVKQGRTISLCQCDVTDAGGSLVAHATCTQMTLPE